MGVMKNQGLLKWDEEGMINKLWKFLDVAKKATVNRDLLRADHNSQP